MKRKADRPRTFNVGVLEELSEAHRRALRKHRVKEPDDAQDLHEWATTLMKTRVGLKWKRRDTKRQFYKDMYWSAAGLREIRAIQEILAVASTDVNEIIERLLFVCGHNGDALKAMFTESGHANAAARGRTIKSERYVEARLPLIERACELQTTTPELTNESAARHVIQGLDQPAWDRLTCRKARTDESIDWQVTKLAELIGVWKRAGTSDETDPMTPIDWSEIRLHISVRRGRELAQSDFVNSLAPPSDMQRNRPL